MRAESAGETKPAQESDGVGADSNVGDNCKYPIDIV